MDVEESLYRRAVEGREAKLGKDHPDTLSSVNNLAGLLTKQGKLEEAEALYRRALEGREAKLGKDHKSTRNSAMGLKNTLNRQGKETEAAAVAQQYGI